MSRARKPVHGLPPDADRPKCVECRTPLRPNAWGEWNAPTRQFHGWKGYPHARPLFCTLRCTLAYAVRVYKAGAR